MIWESTRVTAGYGRLRPVTVGYGTVDLGVDDGLAVRHDEAVEVLVDVEELDGELLADLRT